MMYQGVYEFEYWFRNIIGICAIIVHPKMLHDVWCYKHAGLTSIINYYELFEQLAGDLQLEASINQFEKPLRQAGAYSVVRSFADSLNKINQQVEQNAALQNPDALLMSQEWLRFQSSARKVSAFAQNHEK